MKWQANTLKDALAPLLWLNRILCMGVFEIPSNKPRLLLTITYIICITLIYFVMFYQAIEVYIKDNTNHIILDISITAVNALIAIFSVILFWYNLKNINMIMKRCTIAGDTLQVLGIKKNYKKCFSGIFSCFIVWISSIVILELTFSLRFEEKTTTIETICIFISFTFPLILNTTADITFASLVRLIQVNFQNINDLMNNVILIANEASTFRNQIQRKNKITVRNNYENNKEEIKHLIQTVKQLHLEFTKIGRLVTNIYSIQIVLEFILHFTMIIAAFYGVYESLTGTSRFKNPTDTITLMTIWAFLYSCKIASINNLCSRTSNEAYKTGEYAQTFNGLVLDKEMREEILQFTQEVMLTPLNFTAAGFLTLNNALTGKFFATAMTYVVILIQFRSSSGCNKVSRCHC